MARRKKVRKHPKFWLGFKIFVLLFLLTILIGGLIFYFKYGKQVFAMQDEAKALVNASTVETFRASETSIACDNKGKQIAILKGEKDSYYLEFADIPEYVKNAFLVTEDKKFYSHSGIDAKGILRAGWALIKNNGEKTQGASTITQQLARNVFLSMDKTWERKVKEIFVAKALEEKYTKDQIFEFYLNSIYFASGYYGIEAAAKGYFSKSCKDLSLGQLVFLCSIPNNPNLYNPVKNYNNTIKRKNRILDQMLEDGVITRVEYDDAYNEKIELNQKELTKRDYIQTFITYSATRAIMKKNGFEFKSEFASEDEKQSYLEEYEEEYDNAQHMLLNNGYRIYTSISLKKQKKLQKAVDKELAGFKGKTSNGIYKMQGSAVCIDNKNGRVVAIVGGRHQDTEGYSLNRAYQSFRQPGSSIKPLIVYTPTLERGSTAYTTVNDHRFKGGPANSSGHYYGNVSLHFAVEQSLNTVAWQLFEKLTPEVGLNYLLQMRFSKISKNDYYNAASLGGLTNGVSTLEMASAYSTLANNGEYREPTCVVKITDSSDNIVVDDNVTSTYVYNPKAANTMTEIMKGVLTKGTARGLALDNGMPCAGKTGTTNDKKDGWFCGYTPYFTTAVWVGFDTPKTVDDLYGSTYPGRIWNRFMNLIHSKLEVKEFKYVKDNEKSSSKSSERYYNDDETNDDEGGGGSADIDNDPDDKEDVDTDSDDAERYTAKPKITRAPATEAPAMTDPPKKEKATEAPAPDKDPDDDIDTGDDSEQ